MTLSEIRIIDKHILVVLDELKLHLMDGEKLIRSFPVATGKESTRTPLGAFIVMGKSDNPAEHYAFDNPQDVSGLTPAKFGSHVVDLAVEIWDWDSGLYRGYAIHGTDEPEKIGTACSMGCVRLGDKDMAVVYEFAQPGMIVLIQEGRGLTECDLT